MSKKSEINHDGHETERFVDLASKLIAVPKEKVDKLIAKKQKAKEKKDGKRKV